MRHCLRGARQHLDVSAFCASRRYAYEPSHGCRQQHAGQGQGHLLGVKVVIVGAGPAGICAAMAIANLGASVTVCESRTEATFAGTSKRSYVIILQDRGLHALQAAGFTDLATPESRFLGNVRVSSSGKRQPKKAESSAIGFERRQLAQFLREQATARHPHAIKFKWGLKCVGAVLEDGIVTFQPADARGRADLVPGFTVDRQCSQRSYLPLIDLPANSSLEPPEWRQAAAGGRSLLLWSSRKQGYNLSMNRRPDGTFAGNLTSTPERLAALRSEADVAALLDSAFAGIPDEFVPEICKQVATKEAVPLPDTISTSQLHGHAAVLIGDAAHCVTPILGQGANAALEDTAILADILKASATDAMPEAAIKFERTRGADARALVAINRYFLWATGLGRLSALAFVPVLVHVGLRTVLAAVLPFVPKPAFAAMDKGASYSKMIRGACFDLGCLLAGALLFFGMRRLVLLGP